MSKNKRRCLMISRHGLGELDLEHAAGPVFAYAVKRHQHGAHGGSKHHSQRCVEQDFHGRGRLVTPGKDDVRVRKPPSKSWKKQNEDGQHDLQANACEAFSSDSTGDIENALDVTHFHPPPRISSEAVPRSQRQARYRQLTFRLQRTTIPRGWGGLVPTMRC